MSQPYQTYDFFRRVHTDLLKVYFESKNALSEIDFSALSPRKMQPLQELFWRVKKESEEMQSC